MVAIQCVVYLLVERMFITRGIYLSVEGMGLLEGFTYLRKSLLFEEVLLICERHDCWTWYLVASGLDGLCMF